MEARVASRPRATIFLDLLMSRCWPDVVFIDIWPARLWLGTPYKDSCPGLEFTFLYILCISITADYNVELAVGRLHLFHGPKRCQVVWTVFKSMAISVVSFTEDYLPHLLGRSRGALLLDWTGK